MMQRYRTLSVAVAVLLTAFVWLQGEEVDPSSLRAKADQQLEKGNFRDAAEAYRKIIESPNAVSSDVVHSLDRILQCLQRMRGLPQIDEILKQAEAVHGEHWDVLRKTAETYGKLAHWGQILEGEFVRAEHRGGTWTSVEDYDRQQSLRLFELAMKKMDSASNSNKADLYFQFAYAILSDARSNRTSWKLQSLTEWDPAPELPTMPGNNSNGRGILGAAVDENGDPVVYQLPESWEAAQNDGERWRWLIEQAGTVHPPVRYQAITRRAEFALEQFGVSTMRQVYNPFRSQTENENPAEEPRPFEVRGLSEAETIAQLADGIKRFELPEGYNFIELYQQVLESELSSERIAAAASLASIFENRMQYPRAAEYWKKLLAEPPSRQHSRAQKQLDQIVLPWGSFERSEVRPAGEEVKLQYRFRNGDRVELEAFRLKHDLLIEDVKAMLRKSPKKLDWKQAQISNIGMRVIQDNETRYLGEKVANWDQKLEPREGHLDRRVEVSVPVKTAGAYLVVAKLPNGNQSRIVIWLDEMTIAYKTLDNARWYYLANTKTGEPIPGAKLEFFGFKFNRTSGNQGHFSTSEFAEKTGPNGEVIVDNKLLDSGFQWLVSAKSDQQHHAYLGIDSVWYQTLDNPRYDRTRVFAITDRPVYRPGQSVKYKFWVRNANYTREGKAVHAGKTFPVEIVSPRGDKVYEGKLTADQYGGFDAEFDIPDDATLGSYQLHIPYQNGVGGGVSFRVEEYKKPEFEVTVDAPSEPTALGEQIKATIRAKYYFGAPVTQGYVHYKVQRTTHNSHWYPIDRWDWLYGRGYWWFGQDYDWYPGWGRWGCIAPIPWWWERHPDPPELVMEQEVPIGPDGTVEVTIDTSVAKELFGDQDHKYEITAEVVDESRRTIVGSGNVLVSREPFQVYSWTNRGYYRVGDNPEISFQAQTIDEKPIQGQAELILYSINYDENLKPRETEVEKWNSTTDETGRIVQKFKASQPGQFRLLCRVADKQGRVQEGAVVFLVRGAEAQQAGFRFNDLEVIPEKQSYQPGETVKLLINTSQKNSTVALFVRPVNGIYQTPQILRLNGQSQVVDLKVTAEDYPNFFVEAITLSDAELFTESVRIAVPPEKRVFDITIEPSEPRYLPGAQAEIKVKLTDPQGKPIQGSVVLSVYDRSVEAIAGGSNISDIQSFFWNWTRSHHPHTTSSLQRFFSELIKQKEERMRSLGVFGNLVADIEAKQRMLSTRTLMKSKRGGAVDFLTESAPAPAMMAMDAANEPAGMAGGKPAAEALVMPTVRKEFADTAYWAAKLTPDENGIATIRFPMPENLTDWKIRAWGMADGTRVGEGEATVVTSKDVLVRLQAPRFFVEKDQVIISANIHNYLDEAKQTIAEIELEGGTLELLDENRRSILIPSGGEQRVDWVVRAIGEGEAVITVKALTDTDSDAMQMTFPVYVHGMLKTESYTGVVRPDEKNTQFEVRVPEERRPEKSVFELRYSPTLAAAMVDALPYLLDYPYGCTEQTLNRFLPAVITQRMLLDMKLDLEAIQKKRINMNSQEVGPNDERAAQWKRFDRNPVFDSAEMEKIVKVGLRRLTDMQLSDGGWGWFSGYREYSSPHTTATVVHGLQVARENELALVDGLLERGIQWLKTWQNKQIELLEKGLAEKPESPYRKFANNLDALVHMILVDEGHRNEKMEDFLYRDRLKLSVYSLAMFGLSLEKSNSQKRLAQVLENIDQYYKDDLENETGYIEIPAGYSWWYWHGNEVEANAFYLKLLSKVDPKGERASRIVKYLLNNRKHSTYWNSTRDTALCVEAFSDFLRASGETQPDLELQILVDGKLQREVKITAENLFSFENSVRIEGLDLTSGMHQVEIRKSGTGPLYWNAELTNFTLEDPITAAGLELKVRRSVYKLIPKEDASQDVAGSRGQVVSQNVEQWERVKLEPGDQVNSGDLLEIELGIDSKNDYEYVIVEDFKAAGTEPTDLRSGYIKSANGAYAEFRDEKVAFFFRSISRGTHSVSYRLRAEVPGTFSALPTFSYAMYAPELKANSNEFKLKIEERVRE